MPKKQKYSATRAQRKEKLTPQTPQPVVEAAPMSEGARLLAADKARRQRLLTIIALAVAGVMFVTGLTFLIVSLTRSTYNTDDPIAEITLERDGAEDLVLRFQLFEEKAPIAVGSFVNLAQNKFYEGTLIHRISPYFTQMGKYSEYTNSTVNKLMTAEKTDKKVNYTYKADPESGYKHDSRYVLSAVRDYSYSSPAAAFRICTENPVNNLTSEDAYGIPFGVAYDQETRDNLAILADEDYNELSFVPSRALRIKSVKILANDWLKWRNYNFFTAFSETDGDYTYTK
jgi:cyclophilin family peptidyl-prolyl cis-trans isomerase